jgi:hypothetical protein
LERQIKRFLPYDQQFILRKQVGNNEWQLANDQYQTPLATSHFPFPCTILKIAQNNLGLSKNNFSCVELFYQ